jgi:ribonucleoside-triphosphate reductase
MELAKTSLEIKRKAVQININRGLLPYTKRYLENLDHHFTTIGLVGMNESCVNFLGEGIHTDDGRKFAIKTMDFMRDRIADFQEETGHIYNLEASPAEGTSYRLAKIDKKEFPNIFTQGTVAPYYTNSSQLPANYSDDLFKVLDHQDELQRRYTGGTVLHAYLGEKLEDAASTKKLVRRVAENYKLPYFSVTPLFTICPVHGYIPGAHEKCPYD